ncbi:MAG: phenylalanine--tRNA ligase subunit beta, partial [Myxococcota bacterium]
MRDRAERRRKTLAVLGDVFDLGGRLAAALALPEVAALDVGAGIQVRLDSELCSVYTVTPVERRGGRDVLDDGSVRLLAAAGIHPISAAVDATNIANLELGQPTHAFDADTIVGPITLRLSRPGERAWLLFTPEPAEVPAGTLVVADDAKILAIAGVIGCEESKATASTERLLIESATFDPVAVRKASRALRTSTDASARFERGSDPERPLVGAGRVVALLEAAGWSRSGPTVVASQWTNPGRVIPLRVDAVGEFLAVPLGADEIADRLARYGFRVRPGDPGVVLVTVPSWRLWDVEFSADLYEELAKSLGYDTTPEVLPPIGHGALPSPAEVRKARAEEVLLGYGFYEVLTDGFYGRNVIAQLGLDEAHPLFAHVETTNALERAYSLLKNNALHQAIEAVAVNERRRKPDVKLYEWTRTFHPRGDVIGERSGPDRSPCTERRLLWMVVAGRDRPKAWQDTSRPADAYFLKGILDELGVELGLDFAVQPGPSDHPLSGLLHPGRQARISALGEPVGILGEVHPGVARRYKLKSARPCYLELDAEALFADGARPTYHEPPSTQALTRSVSFGLPGGIEAGDVAAWIHANGPDWLERAAIVDWFVPGASSGGPSSGGPSSGGSGHQRE